MPPAAPPSDVLGIAAGLLGPGDLPKAEALRARYPAGPPLAAALLRAGLLTPLQARWLARGDGARLAVGPYVLRDRLGAGGMGEVFLARHRWLPRPAAVKVARPGAGDAGRLRERFAREVRAAGRLDHPHVVHAYDAGQDRGRLWLALEYVPGPDLGRLAREGGPLPPGRACRYAGQAARGLDHLHGRGLVHRDVKPANLALAADGRVKVLDVGLAGGGAARADGEADLTVAGRLLGSADYAAPEQVEDARRAGPAADQYALGATLYFLLTGVPPFPDGTPVRRALARLTADPAPVEAVRPGVPGPVAAVVRRLLARRPADRYGSAAEAAAALEAAAGVAPAAAEVRALGLAETRFD